MERVGAARKWLLLAKEAGGGLPRRASKWQGGGRRRPSSLATGNLFTGTQPRIIGAWAAGMETPATVPTNLMRSQSSPFGSSTALPCSLVQTVLLVNDLLYVQHGCSPLPPPATDAPLGSGNRVHCQTAAQCDGRQFDLAHARNLVHATAPESGLHRRRPWPINPPPLRLPGLLKARIGRLLGYSPCCAPAPSCQQNRHHGPGARATRRHATTPPTRHGRVPCGQIPATGAPCSSPTACPLCRHPRWGAAA